MPSESFCLFFDYCLSKFVELLSCTVIVSHNAAHFIAKLTIVSFVCNEADVDYSSHTVDGEIIVCIDEKKS